MSSEKTKLELAQQRIAELEKQLSQLIVSTPAVGAVIFNKNRQILVGIKNGAGQLVQGSVDPEDMGDTQRALYREIYEEVGLRKDQLMLVGNAYEQVVYPLKDVGRYPNATHRALMWSCLCVKDANVVLSPDAREFDGGVQWMSVDEFLAGCAEHKKDMYVYVLSIFSHAISGPRLQAGG